MYIQKRKSLEDRINQVVHKMMSLPEEQFAVSIHFQNEDEELPMNIIRIKREEILDREAENPDIKAGTEIRGTLISLYEELFLLEKEQQEQQDEARFKHFLLRESLSSASLANIQQEYLHALTGEKTPRVNFTSFSEENELFKHNGYNHPQLLKHTEQQLAMYNRVVQESRTELKTIAMRYSSDTLQCWWQEFMHEQEEERRQLSMTLN